MNTGVLLCGCGNMGGAILKGAFAQGVLWPKETLILEKQTNDYTEAFQAQGCPRIKDLSRLKEKVQLAILAVKPQDSLPLFHQLYPHFAPEGTLISIMAGVSMETISTHFPLASVIRAMPNTPAAIGRGMTVFVGNDKADEIDLDLTKRIFDCLGQSMEIKDEAMMDGVTALSGSGPAYLFYLAEAMMEAAAKLGFSTDQARLLVNQTLIGASHLIKESGEPPSSLRAKVTSKGGTTAAALGVFQEARIKEALIAGIQAAQARSKELGKK